MKKFLKVLTLSGLTASLMIAGSNFIENSSKENNAKQSHNTLIKEDSNKQSTNKYININFSTKGKSNLEINTTATDLNLEKKNSVDNNSNETEEILDSRDNIIETNNIDENDITNQDMEDIVENNKTNQTNIGKDINNNELSDDPIENDSSNQTTEEDKELDNTDEIVLPENLENNDNYDFIYNSSDIANIDEKYESLKTCLNSALEKVNSLSHRLEMLEEALSTVNSLNSPNFRFYQNPYSNIYGFSYHYFPNLNTEEENYENNEQNDNANSDITNLENENANSDLSNDDSKNFGELNLNSNIDSYGPRRRNIDTFFNTALLDDNMFNTYNGYGYPNYMFGGNPYWNMGYNYFNSNNGYGYPNYQNNNQFYNRENAREINISNESSENSNNPEISNSKKRWTKNIDSYNSKTLKTNINTMNGEKITNVLKNKFSQWFKKDKSSNENLNNYVDNFIDDHQSVNYEDNIQTLEELEDSQINTNENKPTQLTKDIKDKTESKAKILKIDIVNSELNNKNSENNQKNNSEIKNIKLIKENHKNMI